MEAIEALVIANRLRREILPPILLPGQYGIVESRFGFP